MTDLQIPIGLIHWIVDRYHVATPDTEIATNIRKRVGNNPKWTNALISEAVRAALIRHHENQIVALELAQGI